MPKFGRKSRDCLKTLHPDLQEILNEAIKHFDFSILEGHRGEERQNEMFSKGTSKLMFPNGKHNKFPSEAVDIAPYPIVWEDKERFSFFAGFIMGIAKQKGIDLRWGGNWNNDPQMVENNWDDLGHLELLN